MPPLFLQAAAQSPGSKESLVQHEVLSLGVGIREWDNSIPQHQKQLL